MAVVIAVTWFLSMESLMEFVEDNDDEALEMVRRMSLEVMLAVMSDYNTGNGDRGRGRVYGGPD